MLLAATVLSIAAVLLTTVGVVKVTSDLATKSLQAEVINRLIVQRDSQKDRIESYIAQITSEISHQATMDDKLANALVEFSSVFSTFNKQVSAKHEAYRERFKQYYTQNFSTHYLERNNQNSLINADDILNLMSKNTLALQNYYIYQNPHPHDSRHELLIPEEIQSDYSKVHAKYHPKFKDYLNRHGFYDIFLVDAQTGNLVYSFSKALDFATSLTTGPYAKSGLGTAFRGALKASASVQTLITDMQSYYPQFNDFASFVSAPIFIKGKLEGVFIIQLPINKINHVMTFGEKWNDYGLGKSGETYIVADDFTMRNDSRLLIEDNKKYINSLRLANHPKTQLDILVKKKSSIGIQKVQSPSVKSGLSGESGFNIFTNSQDIPVLSAYAPLNIKGLNWVLLAEINEAEAFAAIASMTQSILQTAIIIGIVILLMGLTASLIFVNSIVSPISHFKDAITRFVEGDANARVKLTTNDEIGDLATAFDKLLDEREQALEKTRKDNDDLNDSIISMLQVAAQMSKGDLTVRMDVAENVTGPLADSLNSVTHRTGEVINQVRNTAIDVEHAANSVKEQSDTVLKVTEEELTVVNAAVKDLSDASDELNNIVELAKQCNTVADETIVITDSAQQSVSDSVQGINSIRDYIRETEKRIKRLGERSQEIGGVVDLINGIAEKTHVLALNASMQAASAGEAGRGFAVVANEVQRLAENAREATMEISQQVKNIQVDTANTVTAMNKAITQVVEGSDKAKKGDQLMNATRDKSHELVKLVLQISERSETQAKVAWSLQKQATEIQKTNAQTFEQMHKQTAHTEQLVQLSKHLLDVINEFKVQGQDKEPKNKLLDV